MQKDLFGRRVKKTLEQIKKEREEKERLRKMSLEEPYQYLFARRSSEKTYLEFMGILADNGIGTDEVELYGFYELMMMVAYLLCRR